MNREQKLSVLDRLLARVRQRAAMPRLAASGTTAERAPRSDEASVSEARRFEPAPRSHTDQRDSSVFRSGPVRSPMGYMVGAPSPASQPPPASRTEISPEQAHRSKPPPDWDDLTPVPGALEAAVRDAEAAMFGRGTDVARTESTPPVPIPQDTAEESAPISSPRLRITPPVSDLSSATPSAVENGASAAEPTKSDDSAVRETHPEALGPFDSGLVSPVQESDVTEVARRTPAVPAPETDPASLDGRRDEASTAIEIAPDSDRLMASSVSQESLAEIEQAILDAEEVEISITVSDSEPPPAVGDLATLEAGFEGGLESEPPMPTPVLPPPPHSERVSSEGKAVASEPVAPAGSPSTEDSPGVQVALAEEAAGFQQDAAAAATAAAAMAPAAVAAAAVAAAEQQADVQAKVAVEEAQVVQAAADAGNLATSEPALALIPESGIVGPEPLLADTALAQRVGIPERATSSAAASYQTPRSELPPPPPDGVLAMVSAPAAVESVRPSAPPPDATIQSSPPLPLMQASQTGTETVSSSPPAAPASGAPSSGDRELSWLPPEPASPQLAPMAPPDAPVEPPTLVPVARQDEEPTVVTLATVATVVEAAAEARAAIAHAAYEAEVGIEPHVAGAGDGPHVAGAGDGPRVAGAGDGPDVLRSGEEGAFHAAGGDEPNQVAAVVAHAASAQPTAETLAKAAPIRMMVERAPETSPTPIDVYAQVYRAPQHVAHSVAAFIQQTTLPAPRTFGELLDAALQLGDDPAD